MRKIWILRSLAMLLLLATLGSCSEYQKLLKSNDHDLKYEKAMVYYEKGDYMRAGTLFGGLIGIYRGTEKSETSHYIYADCLYNMKDYITAKHYFSTSYKITPPATWLRKRSLCRPIAVTKCRPIPVSIKRRPTMRWMAFSFSSICTPKAKRRRKPPP